MEIIPNVHQIPGMRGANVYLLLGSTLTLVDSGMPGSEDTILSYVESLDLPPSGLRRIVITHHHLDHVGSVAALRRRTSAEVLAHPADAPFLSEQKPLPPPPGAIVRALFRLVGPLMPRAEPVPVDMTVQDGDRLDLLGGATVVHMPGHTAGSIALHFPSEGLLICGDVIDLRGNRMGPPPKAFTWDMNQAIASLQRLAELEFGVLCAGHGKPVVGGADERVRAMVRDLA